MLAVVSNGLDLLSTYHVSPDLKMEANPVVAFIGPSWLTLFAIKIVGSLVAIALFYFGLRTLELRVDRLAGKKGFMNILGYLFYKRSVTRVTMILGAWPKDWGALLAFWGICFSLSVGLGSFLASVSNMLHLVTSPGHLAGLYLCGGVFSAVAACYLTCSFVIGSPKSESFASADVPTGPPQS